MVLFVFVTLILRATIPVIHTAGYLDQKLEGQGQLEGPGLWTAALNL